MSTQLAIDYTSGSRINNVRLTGQNKRLYDWLLAGNTINCFSSAMKKLRIGYLNSRASDLINKHGININKRRIQVTDVDGNMVTVTEYSLNKFNN